MFEFFELLFSPEGCVGRAVWWLTCILIAIAFVGLSVGAIVIVAVTMAHQNPGMHAASPHLGVTPQEITQMLKAIDSVQPELGFIGVLVLLLFWIGFVIEIKRWHDRGMSGWYILLRYVPAAFSLYGLCYQRTALLLLVSGTVTLMVGLFQLINLGCLPGPELHVSAVAGRSRSRAYREAEDSGWAPGFTALVLTAGHAFFLYNFYLPSAPLYETIHSAFPAHAIAPASVSPAPSQGPSSQTPGTNQAPQYQPSLLPVYGKDWVITTSGKLSGITQVTAAPEQQVLIIYAGGGKNVPVAALPPGFLAEWEITPQALKAADRPAPPPPSQ